MDAVGSYQYGDLRKPLVKPRMGDVRSFLRQQLRQSLLRADVAGFALIQLSRRLHAGRNGDEAVEAARIVGAVFVLCAAVHRSSEIHLRLPMLGSLATPRRDRHHSGL